MAQGTRHGGGSCACEPRQFSQEAELRVLIGLPMKATRWCRVLGIHGKLASEVGLCACEPWQK